MRGFVANTDFDWFTFLRGRQPLEEVNFWQPSGSDAFRALQPGEPFFFRLKSPHYAIGGFGNFARQEVVPAWLAWSSFGPLNGASDFDAMCRRIERYRHGQPPDPQRHQACAVSGEHSLPVLDAAHIRGYAQGGGHEVSNGLLLRTDIHRLFDRGYVTVTPDHRFLVSKRLKEDWENGRIYYAHDSRPISIPKRAADRPDPALLRWHNENVFERMTAP